MKKIIFVVFVVFFYSGCSQSLVGGFDRPLDENIDNGLENRFYQSYSCISPKRKLTIDGIKDPFVCEGTDENLNSKKILKDGFALIKARCGNFFTQMGKEQQEHDINKGYSSLGSNLITSVLSASKVHHDAILANSVLFGLIDGSLNIEQINILFTPDTKALRDIALKALDTHKNKVDEEIQGKTLDYSTAYMLLKENEAICNIDSIKSLVNSAIEKGELKAYTSSSKDSTLLVDTLKDKLSDKLDLGNQPISDDVMYGFWKYIDRKIEVGKLCTDLPADFKSKLCENDSISKDKFRIIRSVIRDLPYKKTVDYKIRLGQELIALEESQKKRDDKKIEELESKKTKLENLKSNSINSVFIKVQ